MTRSLWKPSQAEATAVSLESPAGQAGPPAPLGPGLMWYSLIPLPL